MIKLADGFRLPLELVTESISVLSIKRAGKSYLARKVVEQLYRAGQQVVVVDPKGDWWGIRSAANGRDAGLPIVILGGHRSDVPLEPTGGELVARLVVEQRVSVLLDLADLRKHQVASFMTGFLETLYRLKAREEYRTAMMLVIDEADAVAPQRPMKGEERMLGAAEDIVRRGGQRGIGVVLATQRAAVLNKNVLSQCGILIFLRTLGLHDIEGVEDWINKHGQPEQKAQLMADIASLPRGTAWWWSPAWPDDSGIFRKIKVGAIETFDSMATPRPGERRIAPKTVADVDLNAFRKEMAATIEKVKGEDPRLLRAQIAKFQQEVRDLQQAKDKLAARAPGERRVEVPVLKDVQIQRLEAGIARLEKTEQKIAEALARRSDAIGKLHLAAETLATALQVRLSPNMVRAPENPRARAPMALNVRARTSPRPSPSAAHALPKGEQLVLTAIAQSPKGVTREQLTILTGYRRSTRDTYIQRLRERDLVGFDDDIVNVLEAGLAALGPDFEALPTGDALREHWVARLPEGERRILEILAAAYPRAVDREQLSEKTGYARSSRDTYLQRLRARKLCVSEGRGLVRAAEELFG